jgi:predicted AAA+ superfamily ATPase
MKRVLKLVAAAPSGKELSLDDLIRVLGEGASRQAMQSTIRYLEGKYLLERVYETRGGKVRMVLRPTPRGSAMAAALER